MPIIRIEVQGKKSKLNSTYPQSQILRVGVMIMKIYKKIMVTASLAIMVVILSSFGQKKGTIYSYDSQLVTKQTAETERNKGLERNIPLYTSKFWQGLTVDDIPNNYKEYNCTATVQMLYNNWLKHLSRELGYESVEEMASYSSKVIEIKKTIEETLGDPIALLLAVNDPLWLGVSSSQKRECQLKINNLLTSYQLRGLPDWASADNLLLKVGLIDDDYKSSTWEVFELIRAKGGIIFEKTDNDGRSAFEIWKREERYLPLDHRAMDGVIPGDIMTGKYYATHYPEKYTTHLTIYLGERDQEDYFAEQFGLKVKITPLERMYRSLRTGFEARMRPIVVISPEKTEEFLFTPLESYNLNNWKPDILIFKDKAQKYIHLVQQRVMLAKGPTSLDKNPLSPYLVKGVAQFL